MNRIEILHKNQCDGLISDGFVVYTNIESKGLIHDLYIDNRYICKLRGTRLEQQIILEDTTE